MILCLTERHQYDTVSSRGVVQILNNVSRIHKQRQIDNREAVAAKHSVLAEPDVEGSSEEVVMVWTDREWSDWGVDLEGGGRGARMGCLTRVFPRPIPDPYV